MWKLSQVMEPQNTTIIKSWVMIQAHTPDAHHPKNKARELQHK